MSSWPGCGAGSGGGLGGGLGAGRGVGAGGGLGAGALLVCAEAAATGASKPSTTAVLQSSLRFLPHPDITHTRTVKPAPLYGLNNTPRN